MHEEFSSLDLPAYKKLSEIDKLKFQLGYSQIKQQKYQRQVADNIETIRHLERRVKEITSMFNKQLDINISLRKKMGEK